jgi:hypothetical protein
MIHSRITEKTKASKMIEHPHTVIGNRRGFQVRVYHDPEWQIPYFVTIISGEHGWIMDGTAVPTEAAAQTEAIDMLASLDGGTLPIGNA